MSPDSATLPIHALADELRTLAAVRQPPALVLTAPTGSGKSTQVPQILADMLPPATGSLLVLQPRRLAARMLAQRVARERGSPLGTEVGYHVRFDQRAQSDTRILFMTEGVLLRRLLDDPELGGVGGVILDEFHERNLQNDLVLALLRQLRAQHRPDLRLIVMSATLAPGPLADYLHPARTLECEARTFPVDIRYQPIRTERGKPRPHWDAAAAACDQLWRDDPAAEVLVFMPGKYEIRKTLAAVEALPGARGRRLLPLFSDLPPAQQDQALEPSDRPRVIVATNVAETSLTIDGITAVVDCGLARASQYDPRRGIDTLTIQPISQASAEQRAGRAGRTRPGRCIRLWRESDHPSRPAADPPAIQRLDPVEAFLQLLAMGWDPRRFPWFEAPLEDASERAWALLHRLGAIEIDDLDPPRARQEIRLTSIGRRMARLPLHPRFSRMLLAADDGGDPTAGAFCAAVCQGRPLMTKDRGPAADRFHQRGDRSDIQALWRAWTTAHQNHYRVDWCRSNDIHGGTAREIGASLRQLLGLSGCITNLDQIARRQLSDEVLANAMLTGLPDRVGAEISRGERLYQLPDGRRAKLAPGHHIQPPVLLVAAELAEIEGRDLRLLLSTLTEIDREQLEQQFQDRIRTLDEDIYDEQARRVVRRHRVCLESMPIEDRESGQPDPEAAANLLAQRVLAGDLLLKKWDNKVENWITRLNQLADWMPELELPPLVDDDRAWLIARVCHGATSYRQIKDRPVWPSLNEWLSEPQRAALDAFAPPSIQLANGRKTGIIYSTDLPPTIRLTVQQLYGVDQTPTIADGRVSLRVEILAPNQRPVQWTSDLASFWSTGYPAVKKQLQGRYPKHEWR